MSAGPGSLGGGGREFQEQSQWRVGSLSLRASRGPQFSHQCPSPADSHHWRDTWHRALLRESGHMEPGITPSPGRWLGSSHLGSWVSVPDRFTSIEPVWCCPGWVATAMAQLEMLWDACTVQVPTGGSGQRVGCEQLRTCPGHTGPYVNLSRLISLTKHRFGGKAMKDFKTATTKHEVPSVGPF